MSCNEDTQSNIRGPYSFQEWRVMLMLKEGIAYMSQRPDKFGSMLKEEKERHKKYLSKGIT